MTEAEWLESTDVVEMLKSLDGKTTDRKLRPFGCACCRRVWDSLVEECFRHAVEVAEQFADGLANKKDLATARKVSGAALERTERPRGSQWARVLRPWECLVSHQDAGLDGGHLSFVGLHGGH